MTHEERAHDPERIPDVATDRVPDEPYRIVRIVVVAVAIVSMGLALLAKYLVTGNVVRDGFGWVMLALQIVFVVALPMAIFRPRSGRAS